MYAKMLIIHYGRESNEIEFPQFTHTEIIRLKW